MSTKNIANNFRFDYFEEYAKANAFKEHMNNILDEKLEDGSIYESDFRITWHGKELSTTVYPETFEMFQGFISDIMDFWNELIEEEVEYAKKAMIETTK